MADLWFQILGPATVTREGRVIDLGSPKQRALLVALLLEPGRVVPLRRLLNLLWADPPVSATANVRTYASGLRKALGPVLAARGGGYMLDVAAADSDLGQFTAETAAAWSARASGDPAAAERHYEKALGMWRGSCGQDLPPDLPLHHQLLTVTERRAVALEEYAELRLEQGGDPRLPDELRQALAENPTREGLWAHLMRALAATGDVAGALEAFQRARAELAGRLGVGPGPELEKLHRSILAREPLAAKGSTTARQAGAEHVAPHELPALSPVFIGRDEAVEHLVRVGRRGRPVVLAIDGPGGIGKSRLAIELAHRLAESDGSEGEIFVDLQGGRPGLRPPSSAEVLARLLRSLGVRQAGEEDVDRLCALWRSVSHGRRLIVVLDDAFDAEQVRPLLPNGSGCTVVITSRRGLTALDVTVRLTLSTLDVGDSIGILRAHGLAGSGDGLRQIAVLCGGLPLALRMAAARLGSRADLTAGDFAARLADDRRRLSELGLRDTGVRATFTSSFEALADSADPVDREAARLFCLLGVLPVSTCAVGAAYALIDANPEHGDACVGRLVELHLVTCDAGGLRLHDLLRLFAREMAGAVPDQQALHRAVWFYARSAQLAWRRVRPLGGSELTASPLVRAGVVECSSREEALRWLAEVAPSLREIAFALPSLAAVPAAVGVAILRCLVSGDGVAGSFRDTLAVSASVVEHAARSGDPLAQLVAHRLMAVNLQRLCRFRDAKEAVAPAMELMSIVDDPVERITTWNTVGIFQTEWGDYPDAERSLRSGLRLAREHGHGPLISLLLHSLGMYYRTCGELSRAIPLLREALDIRLSLHDEIGETYTRMQLGKALGAIGEVAQGLGHLDIALVSAGKMDSDELDREIRVGRMYVLSRAGRLGDAAGELRAALEACKRLNDEALTAEVLREAEQMSIAI